MPVSCAHETFNGLDRRQWVFNQQRFRLVPNLNPPVGEVGDNRRQQRVPGLRIGNHAWCITIHERDQAIGRSKVNAHYPFHDASLSLSTSRSRVRRYAISDKQVFSC
jgi:hypothetical protein